MPMTMKTQTLGFLKFYPRLTVMGLRSAALRAAKKELRYKLFTGLRSVRILKNCDLGLKNAALGLRPRAAFLRPRYIRTDPKPANDIYLLYD